MQRNHLRLPLLRWCTLVFILYTCFQRLREIVSIHRPVDQSRLWHEKVQRLNRYALSPPVAVCGNHTTIIAATTSSLPPVTCVNMGGQNTNKNDALRLDIPDVLFVIHDSHQQRRQYVESSVGYGDAPGIRFYWFSSSDTPHTHEGRRLSDGTATLWALRAARRLYPRVKWFVKGDDDTYFFVPHLLTLLQAHNHSAPYYMGFPLIKKAEPIEMVYASGGAGYVLSGTGVDVVVNSECWLDDQTSSGPTLTMFEDLNTALCALKVQPPLLLTPVYGFFPFTPDVHKCGQDLLSSSQRDAYFVDCVGIEDEEMVAFAQPPAELHVQPISRHYIQPILMQLAPLGVTTPWHSLPLNLNIYTKVHAQIVESVSRESQRRGMMDLIRAPHVLPAYMFAPIPKLVFCNAEATDTMVLVSCFLLCLLSNRALIVDERWRHRLLDKFTMPLNVFHEHIHVRNVPTQYETTLHRAIDIRRRYILSTFPWSSLVVESLDTVLPEEVLIIISGSTPFASYLLKNPLYRAQLMHVFRTSSSDGDDDDDDGDVIERARRWLLRPRK